MHFLLKHGDVIPAYYVSFTKDYRLKIQTKIHQETSASVKVHEATRLVDTCSKGYNGCLLFPMWSHHQGLQALHDFKGNIQRWNQGLVYLPTSSWFLNRKNVGEYTSHTDPMGNGMMNMKSDKTRMTGFAKRETSLISIINDITFRPNIFMFNISALNWVCMG